METQILPLGGGMDALAPTVAMPRYSDQNPYPSKHNDANPKTVPARLARLRSSRQITFARRRRNVPLRVPVHQPDRRP